jgi:anti-sigma factor RsiW
MRVASHRRFRGAISRYADGELDAPTAEALAIHLLECDRCSQELAMVRAIKGSLRRLAENEPTTLAAIRLQRWAPNPQEIPAGQSLQLRDRGVRRLVGPTRRQRFRIRVGALAAVVAAIAATGALLLHRPDPAPDPATVAALVELARLEPPAPLAAGNGERAGQPPGRILELGDRKVSLVRHVVDGRGARRHLRPRLPDAR